MASESQLPDGISPAHRVYIGVSAMMTFLSTLAVFLRLTSRTLSVNIKLDDWTCVGALVFVYGVFITIILSATVGRSGYPTELYDRITLERRAKIILANAVLYNTSVSLAKTSVLLLYRRIFTPVKAFLYVTVTMGLLVLGYWLTTVFGLIFAYSPVEAQWKPWIPHTIINYKAYGMAMGIANIALDLMILAMPQPLVWHLQMSHRRKVLLSGLFTLGGFVCVASIVRVYYLSWTNYTDLTRTQYLAGIWTVVEANMSIICACLPMMPNLVKALKRRSNGGIKLGSNGESATYLRPSDGGKSSRSHVDSYNLRSLPSTLEAREEEPQMY